MVKAITGKSITTTSKSITCKVVPCEIYSRVVGYFRPVSNWNDGKRKEFEDRRTVSLGSFKKLVES